MKWLFVYFTIINLVLGTLSNINWIMTDNAGHTTLYYLTMIMSLGIFAILKAIEGINSKNQSG